jgi:hypothetical protein
VLPSRATTSKRSASLWADTSITNLCFLFFRRASPPHSSDGLHRPLQHLRCMTRKLHPSSGNSTPSHAHRDSSSSRRIRWPWWLEPSSNASTPTPTSSTSSNSRSQSGSSRPHSVDRLKTVVKPILFINLESDNEDGIIAEQSRSADAKFTRDM